MRVTIVVPAARKNTANHLPTVLGRASDTLTYSDPKWVKGGKKFGVTSGDWSQEEIDAITLPGGIEALEADGQLPEHANAASAKTARGNTIQVDLRGVEEMPPVPDLNKIVMVFSDDPLAALVWLGLERISEE